MSDSYNLSSAKRSAIYEIRDSLALGSNSLRPEELRDLSKKLDAILAELPQNVSEKWTEDGSGQRKKAAMSLGILCKGINDLGDVAAKERKGVSLEGKRRMAKAGGISSYGRKLQEEGERAIKALGFEKSEIEVMDFD